MVRHSDPREPAEGDPKSGPIFGSFFGPKIDSAIGPTLTQSIQIEVKSGTDCFQFSCVLCHFLSLVRNSGSDTYAKHED